MVSHQLHRANELYGTFGVVLGLVAWLYLQAEATLWAAEVDVVLAKRLWPVSVLPNPKPSRADADCDSADDEQPSHAEGPPAISRTRRPGPAAAGDNESAGGKRPRATVSPHATVRQGRPHDGFAARDHRRGRLRRPIRGAAALRKAGFQVTMIDKNLYSTFQPLLYQVATGGLNPGDVSYAVGGLHRPAAHPLRPRRPGRASTPAARRIKLTDGRELGYDYLMIATGVLRRTTSASRARPRTPSGSTPAPTPSCSATTS